jgi:hypothetical protein
MNRKQGRVRSSYKQKTKRKTTNMKRESLLQQKQKTNMGNWKGE